MSEPRMTVLSNGMKVVTQHLPSRQVYANLKVDVGARDETEAEAGISHFLEHMLAADTERMTVEENAAALQRMRGISNASTGYENTCFEFSVNKSHTEDAVEMLADGILRSTITPQRLEAERGSIMQEWQSDSTDVDDRLDQSLLQVAFPNSGLDKSIDGSPELINSRSREDLLDFMQRHYSGDKMVLTLVGDVDHDAVCEMAEKHFAGLQPHSAGSTMHKADYRGGMRTHYNNSAVETCLNIGFGCSGSNEADNLPAETVLASVLAGSFAARLTVELRNETGLVYDVSAENQPFRDTGLFKISTACDGEDVYEVLERTCDTLRGLSASLTQEELEQAKAELVGELERSMLQPGSVAELLSDAAMNDGKVYSIDDIIEQVEAVSLEDVKSRADAIFSTPPSIAATGNRRHRLPSYNEITEMLGQERALDASGLAAVDNLPSTDRSVGEAQLKATPSRSQGQQR
jgi:predicted Zn-dependent peptidase